MVKRSTGDPAGTPRRGNRIRETGSDGPVSASAAEGGSAGRTSSSSSTLDRRRAFALDGRRAVWVVVLGAWLLLSVIVASQDYVEGLLGARRLSFPLLLAWASAVLLYWVLVSPLILWLGRRLPFERGLVVSRVLLHLGLASIVALTHAPLAVGITALLKPFPVVGEMGLWRGLGFAVVYSFHTGFLLYWVILGSGVAYEAYRRARQRELKAARLEAELGRARLRALEAQIQPHFLFNALNTISMMVRGQDNDQAVETIAELGELLRSSLRGAPRHEVPLAQELELVGRYLHVERCRFDDRLQVDIEVQPEAEQALVPHLVLQPLVENAVRHGISRSTAPGLVQITGRIDRDRLLLEVHDNGPGPPADWSPETGCGVGLENVRVRLEQLYGADHGLTLFERPGGGTVACLRIPYHLQELLPPEAE